jgi:hypothetical protein
MSPDTADRNGASTDPKASAAVLRAKVVRERGHVIGDDVNAVKPRQLGYCAGNRERAPRRPHHLDELHQRSRHRLPGRHGSQVM